MTKVPPDETSARLALFRPTFLIGSPAADGLRASDFTFIQAPSGLPRSLYVYVAHRDFNRVERERKSEDQDA